MLANNSAQAHNPNLAFGTFFRNVLDGAGKLKYKNDTHILRNDINWNKFGETILKEFPGGGNIIISACSDGSEVYSTMLAILKASGFNYKTLSRFKFSASDVEPYAITRCKSGILSTRSSKNNMIYDDTKKFRDFMGEKLYDYFSPTDSPHTFEISPKLSNLVDFNQANIIEKTAQKDFFGNERCLFMFRNALPYLKPGERTCLLSNLSANMPKNSLLVTGEYEKMEFKNMDEMLKPFGFKPVFQSVGYLYRLEK